MKEIKLKEYAKRINPPIRGSIDMNKMNELLKIAYQSPYKGFNRNWLENQGLRVSYQSPYKGFNRHNMKKKTAFRFMYQSPYKGFNRTR